MQQIERYGVIALVFLLVTIVAVSFWSDGDEDGFLSRLRRDEAAVETAATRRDPAAQAASTRRSLGEDLPLSTRTMTQRNAPAPQASPSAAPDAGAGQRGPRRQQPDGSRPQQQRQATPAGPRQPLSAGAVAEARNLPVQPPPSAQAAPAPRIAAQAPAPEPVRETQRAVPQAAATAPPAGVHVVAPGESLSVIAENRLGSSRRWVEIQALNGGLDPARLSVGMKLKLPAASVAAGPESRGPERKPEPATRAEPAIRAEPAPRSEPAVANRPAGKSHTVQRGETLSEIAEARLGSSQRWNEIVKLNPGLDPRRLPVGAALALPADAGAAQRESLVADAGPSRPAPATAGRGRVR